jgi:2,3-bisphosphoglycerate-independent phosphoglycerate mutase
MTETCSCLAHAVESAIAQGKNQYFMDPFVISDAHANPIGVIRDNDAVIFCCRRGEREVQLTRAFVDPHFNGFPVQPFNHLTFVTMTRYHESFTNVPVAFPPASIPRDTLGEVISKNNLRQLRVAESEKFAHITFFLNGGSNQPLPGEDRICIPSIKDTPFDEVPELRSREVAQTVVEHVEEKAHQFIAVNFANGDIIGHLENFEARVKCAEALDAHLGQILESALHEGYTVLITADHGLLERGYGPDGFLNLHHTQNPVPFVLANYENDGDITLREGGALCDIAPTILNIMGLPKPSAMTGESLISKPFNGHSAQSAIVLIVMDGWGIGSEDKSNPIFVARTPVWDDLKRRYPTTTLKASGGAVGLLMDKPGNSEAGHMNIGAGRVILQDDVRIDNALKDGSYETNAAFLQAIEDANNRGGALHLITMLSNRSSHGSLDYPLALLRLAKKNGLKQVYIHTIFNRPYRTETAPNLLRAFKQEIDSIGIGQCASGIGRGLALDRDGDYQKTKRAYDALVFGIGTQVIP